MSKNIDYKKFIDSDAPEGQIEHIIKSYTNNEWIAYLCEVK